MADKKISQLTGASTPLAGTEVLPIVQSGSTVKVSSDDLTVKNVRSNATTGILQVTGPAAASTRVMTVPDADFTAARTDTSQTFTGAQTFSDTVSATKLVPTGNVTAGNGMFLPTTNTIAFSTGGTERTRVTSTGELLVGSTATQGKWYNLTTYTPTFQVEKSFTSGLTASQYLRAGFITNSNDSNATFIGFAKSRGTTDGSTTAVQLNDGIAALSFQGADGSEFVPAADIQAAVDGTPAANDMPGRLTFRTTASGAAAPTERMRITSAGNIMIGGTANRGTTVGTNALQIFNGTAPAGTLTNGISLYSSGGEAYVMDAAGNATLFSPHDSETNEWIFKSKHTPTGKVLKIDVERLLKFVNDHFGLDAVHEFIEE